ncbi:hypothetical protein OHC51_21795 [Stenotrophomonas indicatrix]|uniref:KfrB domain-containing protein n=1 Tax=Stenotrophomonas indicatrix TaxID=2045451 RepID=UPI00300AF26D
MADAVKTEQSPEPTAAQKAIAKKLSTLMPGAKLFEPRAGGSYYGPVVGSDRNFILQQVGEGTVIAHPKSQLALEKGAKFTGQIVTIAHPRDQVIGAEQHRATVEPADPSRWQERQARTPANQEHVDIARAALGQKFSVYNAASADRGLSPNYTGVIAATTDEHLIQRINSQTAIVHHVGSDVAKQFGAGQEASIQYDNGLFKSASAIERTSGQEQGRATRSRSAEPARTPDDKAKAASWALAKNITAKMHGPESKFYSARRLDAEKGKFRGAIVAVTDHHVIQRIGDSNKFVSHSREDVRGELQVGTFAQINYRDGQAQSVRVQRGQDRQQPPSQERERRNQLPAPDPRRASPAQGMSR